MFSNWNNTTDYQISSSRATRIAIFFALQPCKGQIRKFSFGKFSGILQKHKCHLSVEIIIKSVCVFSCWSIDLGDFDCKAFGSYYCCNSVWVWDDGFHVITDTTLVITEPNTTLFLIIFKVIKDEFSLQLDRFFFFVCAFLWFQYPIWYWKVQVPNYENSNHDKLRTL